VSSTLFPTPGELAEAIARPYGTLVHVLAYGGLRCGEAAALLRARCNLLRVASRAVESVADVNGVLHFRAPKTHEARTVRLPSFVSDMLARHLEDEVDDDPRRSCSPRRGVGLHHATSGVA